MNLYISYQCKRRITRRRGSWQRYYYL